MDRTILARPALHRLLLIGVTVAVYANALPNAFHLDDFYRVSGNPEIRQFWPPWRHFFDPQTSSTLPRIAQFRPLMPLSFSVDYALFGSSVVGFHASALLFQLLAALLLYAISQRLLRRSLSPQLNGVNRHSLALIVALLFAIHPVSANPVNYISARDLLLMLFFLFTSFYCYLRFDEGGNKSALWYGAALATCLLSLLAKTNAVVLPFLLLALELTVFVQSPRSLRPWLRTLPFALLVAAFFCYTTYFLEFSDLSRVRPDVPVSPWAYALAQAKFHLTYYLRNLVWPFAMRQDPAVILPTGLTDPWAITGGLFILGTIVLALLQARKRPLLAFAILAYWLCLAPTSSLVPLRRVVVDYRPYPGLAFLLLALALISSELLRPRMRTALASMALIYCATSTIWFNTIWRSEQSLWQHAVKQGAGATAQHNLAMSLSDLGQRISHLRQALAINPNYVLAQLNLGRALVVKGEIEKGLSHCRHAVRLAPDWAQTHYWLGRTLIELGRTAEALPHLRRAAQLDLRNLSYKHQARQALIKLQDSAEKAEDDSPFARSSAAEKRP